MKKSAFVALLSASITSLFGQDFQNNKTDSISYYFREIKEATAKRTKIWNKDLYGEILLVDPENRQFYSNEKDITFDPNDFKKISEGKIPDTINIANTSIQWRGRNWAMIMLPLPADKYDRINLMSHELFHKAQNSLGFTQGNKQSDHLDQRDGRAYLRLELVALLTAILSDSSKEQKKYLTDAISFRNYRHSLFPNSASIENELELNEGLAEYTGFMISSRDRKHIKDHFTKAVNTFIKNPTYVRSFAYQTIPMYGYLLNLKEPYWNQQITNDSDLTKFFINHLQIKTQNLSKKDIDKLAENYNGPLIFKEEQIRADKIKKLIHNYKLKFIDKPHLDIHFEKMSVSFDPRNILPIEDKGTVYPQIRVTDTWGILEVHNGALMSKNWDKITITAPLRMDDPKIEGDGWTLLLNKAYTIRKDDKTGNFTISKK
ncbi:MULTISPECIES: hypothetical protein [Chryseobacterium]|uniref:DUF1570 domain-containing protein n=1 Tax=Chryseobacterium camelliae TaxID=1265445 RepID=A0ABU0TGW8_9FLAO|nr:MULTISPECIES: hypothetical protein [Chryseobacterium]MDT3405998.1 hypothetical protein [Pseudacidovorax intermedius]MDQ1096201.1 hypothetical protein [Chryseobacterium camelliae]MDQ1100138.1 hypothetical protein [Chryseobacterium sp. SORGH_AS_1048]MDR6087481.1 hypothetical protein [Chryseobacterium sp. SORGH_AS_0909]MDR6131855.1 hypothetical protein [Chryseobacterium sp. SORGH_AS_1175]